MLVGASLLPAGYSRSCFDIVVVVVMMNAAELKKYRPDDEHYI